MQPLNSPLVWGGLAAAGVAVPIIIHLLYRKHRQETDWAAMELLRRALVIRSGQVKLEDYLILALRCLALALIAAALLRPTLNSQSAPLMGQQRVGMVIAIDASYSMNHGEHSRYEKAIEKVRQILAEAQQGDPVTLVLMSNRPEILLRRTSYDEERFDKVLDGQSKPSPYRLSLEKNLAQLDELVSELKTPARECYLITDAQEVDWATLSEAGRDSLSRLTRSASVFVAPVASDGEEENLSITRLAYTSGSLQESGVARFTAEVANLGRRRSNSGTVQLSVDGNKLPQQVIAAMEPGQSHAVSFFTSFKTPGDVRLAAHLSKDKLADDNERYAVVNVRPSGIRVLCVDDESADDASESRNGAYYALRALRLRNRGGDDDPVRVHRIHSADLIGENLNHFDLVLLANVADLPADAVQRLDGFLRRGGGLIVFVGDRVDAEIYNHRFQTDDGPLLPATLGDTLAVGEEEESWAIGPVQSDHPLAGIVKRLPQDLRDTARFSKFIAVEPTAKGRTVLTLTRGDAPLLVTGEVEAGSVLLFTSSADRSWNELAVHPLYAMLLQQAITNMTSRPDARRITVGESAKLPVPGRKLDQRVQITDPDGIARDAKVIPAGKSLVCPIETQRVGFYSVEPGEGAPSVALAANVDPAESNVRVIDAVALANELSTTGVQVVTAQADLKAAIENGRQGRELTNLLLALGIVIFLAQSLLAKYFTNRISSGESDVSVSLQLSRVAAARRT